MSHTCQETLSNVNVYTIVATSQRMKTTRGDVVVKFLIIKFLRLIVW